MFASDPSIVDGIVVGATGGAIAGLTVSLAHYIHTRVVECDHKKRVLAWLKENVEDLKGKRHRSTRAIASYNNLTEDRVRFICSHHEDIYLSIGEEEDVWGLYGIGRDKPKN
jgi:hypothetical protein